MRQMLCSNDAMYRNNLNVLSHCPAKTQGGRATDSLQFWKLANIFEQCLSPRALKKKHLKMAGKPVAVESLHSEWKSENQKIHVFQTKKHPKTPTRTLAATRVVGSGPPGPAGRCSGALPLPVGRTAVPGWIQCTALIKSDTSLLHCCIDLLPFWLMWFCDVGGWRFHEISCLSLDSTWIFEPWGPGWLIQCAHPPAMGHASALCYPKCWHNKARVQPISIKDIEESTIEMIYMMNRWGRSWISC